MAFTPRFKEKIVKLDNLHSNLTPRLQEFPHLAKDHAALESLLATAHELESRQESVQGELRRINQQRTELEKQGRDLRSRLAAGLRSALGLDNAELAQFGFQPRQPVQRRFESKRDKAERLAREAAKAAAEVQAELALRAAREAKARAAVTTGSEPA